MKWSTHEVFKNECNKCCLVCNDFSKCKETCTNIRAICEECKHDIRNVRRESSKASGKWIFNYPSCRNSKERL